MDEKEYELIRAHYCRSIKRIKVSLLETTYKYKKKKGKNGEPRELDIVKKKVKAVLRATSDVLEGLPYNEDAAVRKYCEQIAECVGEAHYPIWYRRLLVERERDSARDKLRAERVRVDELFERELRPYREEAKKISSALLSSYAAAEYAREALGTAVEAYDRFDEKSKRMPCRILWWRYSPEKRERLAGAVADSRRELSERRESIRALESGLHTAAGKISRCEEKRAIEMSRFDAREDMLEHSYSERLDMLK